MSELKKILNSIQSWVQQHRSEPLEYIKLFPGLTIQQIEAELTELPYKISSEIIELYQWHNGSSDARGWPSSFLPFPEGDYGIQSFLSLGEAVSLAIEWNDSIFPNMNAFPLFSVEDVMYWTIGSEKQTDIAPIYSGDAPDISSDPEASSLTAFFEKVLARLQPSEG